MGTCTTPKRARCAIPPQNFRSLKARKIVGKAGKLRAADKGVAKDTRMKRIYQRRDGEGQEKSRKGRQKDIRDEGGAKRRPRRTGGEGVSADRSAGSDATVPLAAVFIDDVVSDGVELGGIHKPRPRSSQVFTVNP